MAEKIVQIMIQAKDLAQILYRGHSSRTRVTQPFSKMAAMGYPEIIFFALNRQKMVYVTKFCYLLYWDITGAPRHIPGQALFCVNIGNG